MWRRVLLIGAAAAATACTVPNPRNCANGKACTDPSIPFCDVDGQIAGEPNTCIAVSCTPGELGACRGDVALTCNAEGNDFDLLQCPLGCDPAGGGCRLCEPSQTSCTNGTLATCDDSGAVVASQVCPLGCFEDEPRCRDIDPSNGLAEFLDMVPNPPDLDLTGGATINTSSGEITQSPTVSFSVPNFLAPAQGNGVPIRVFVVNNLILDGGSIRGAPDLSKPPGPAAAFLARGTVTVRSELFVGPSAGSAVADCNAGQGREFIDQDDRFVSSGGAGGGNATAGSDGGAVMGIASPVSRAPGGSASGTDELVPLRGGCSGGFALTEEDPPGSFPSGGGALQISSGRGIVIEGVIKLSPVAQFVSDVDSINGGGGAGGSLLLEAPTVTLGPAAQLLAGGADGIGCDPPLPECSTPGQGATATTAATRAGDVESPRSGMSVASGGGGGGLGRVRVNTLDQTFTTTNTTLIDAKLTTGSLSTR